MPDVNGVSAAPTHNTAETLSVEAAGVEFAYRRFGGPAELPLVMLQHFRGNLDNGDPALTEGVVLNRHGEAPYGGIQRRALRNRPRTQHIADLQTQVEVQAGGVMQLYDEARHVKSRLRA